MSTTPDCSILNTITKRDSDVPSTALKKLDSVVVVLTGGCQPPPPSPNYGYLVPREEIVSYEVGSPEAHRHAPQADCDLRCS